MPYELKTSRIWTTIFAWILQNRDRLIWSEELGCYLKLEQFPTFNEDEIDATKH